MVFGNSEAYYRDATPGGATEGIAYRPYRWTKSGGMQDLSALLGNSANVYHVSADGSVIVGAFSNGDGQRRPFRWSQSGGFQDLGILPGAARVSATGVSADGSVVVGQVKFGERISAGKCRLPLDSIRRNEGAWPAS